ncbi:MAG: T9SS type A sorting domain-containing protein [Saprospiraceae bacterium]
MKKAFRIPIFLLPLLFLLFSAEKCAEVTDLEAPETVATGVPFNFSVRGKTTTPFTTDGKAQVGLFLSIDSKWDPEDHVVAEKTFTDLEDYRAYSWSASVTLPDDVISGKYYLIAGTPYDGSLGSELFKMNPMYRQVQVTGLTPAGPDLVPTDLWVNEEWQHPRGANQAFQPGDNCIVSFSVRNIGILNAAQIKLRFYLSLDNVVSPDDLILLDKYTFGGIPSFTRRDIAEAFPIPENAFDDFGSLVYLIIQADVDNQVAEGSESNNTLSEKLMLAKKSNFDEPPVEGRSGTAEAARMTETDAAIQMTIAPNPAADNVRVSFRLNAEALLGAQLFNNSGTVVKNIEPVILPPDDYTFDFDVRGLPTGVYFARIEVNEHRMTKKLIIQR